MTAAPSHRSARGQTPAGCAAPVRTRRGTASAAATAAATMAKTAAASRRPPRSSAATRTRASTTTASRSRRRCGQCRPRSKRCCSGGRGTPSWWRCGRARAPFPSPTSSTPSPRRSWRGSRRATARLASQSSPTRDSSRGDLSRRRWASTGTSAWATSPSGWGWGAGSMRSATSLRRAAPRTTWSASSTCSRVPPAASQGSGSTLAASRWTPSTRAGRRTAGAAGRSHTLSSTRRLARLPSCRSTWSR
mmetsp:Transcript_45155/g.146736  ORF Transcript_45155/g.146736 Transcript_45155/m.146736 type:complete len:248 (-) Transcript_45155:234-977(-)